MLNRRPFANLSRSEDIAQLQTDQFAAPQFAVDGHVEKREIPEISSLMRMARRALAAALVSGRRCGPCSRLCVGVEEG